VDETGTKETTRTLTLIERLRSEVVGVDVQVPLLSGETRTYVNLDNASSTPPFRPVVEKVDEFMRYYSNVARGTGFKSQIASWAYEESRSTIARFLGADPAADTVIMTRNTTESLNRLAALFPFKPDSVVLTTLMEHTSNNLPWRRRARVVYAGLKPDGSLDLNDFEARLKELRGRVALVAVTGASNVTGWVNPIHLLARLAHEVGARIVVDAAQIAPHRPIDMRKPDDPGHLDFVAFSGHKTYAPYGIGVLAGNKSLLRAPEPALVGGGVVDLVTPSSVVWRDLPSREEAGTPTAAGAVALAAAINLLAAAGWDAITRHEAELTRYALDRIGRIPGIKVYGKTGADDLGDRIGTIAFNVDGKPDRLVAAVLACEAGVGARCGLFCAHPYIFSLLGMSERAAEKACESATCGHVADLPGVVRASFGLYNDKTDADALCDCLEAIAQGRHGKYDTDPRTGECWPQGRLRLRPADYFSLAPRLPAQPVVSNGKFATAVNCMDGRAQLPVTKWMKREHNVDYVDTITEPGPVRILADATDAPALESIKRRLSISLKKHGSSRVAIVAHVDCAGNPVDKKTQLSQLRMAAATVGSWGFGVQLDLLWLGDDWQVERVG